MTIPTSLASLLPLLRQIPLFGELNDAALLQLAERCLPKSVAAGSVLFTTGEDCRGLYMIESGRVRIYRTSPEGREQVIHIEGPGHTVAELPLFDGGPYPASAETIEESRLLFLPREAFEHLYRSQPDIAQAIIRAIGRRLRHLVRLTETLAFRDVAARLALLLVGYAEAMGTVTPVGIELELRKGLVQPLGRNRLLVPDLSRLRALLPAAGSHEA
jgi:CRP-like cAMP-binding protein